ncbi:unnamed protein product [Psylliodes chrysocephalus]|uniref:BPL/LPL catalytic domain-containing protein n=1 Tax=Psylliodes chrysocephalus TaxID=3402493 RepID=A0A9P0GC60_9CUCU|nr:unnamed protein product [Psylliodes chrysocephala]
MIFTIFYMYATVMQWWRLSALRNKLNGTLNSKNALLLCDETVVYESKKNRSFENLLFRVEERLGCTVVPKQRINLSQWIIFPKDSKYFPIYFRKKSIRIESPNIYVLIQAMLDEYIKHSASILQVENFGELVAWKVSDTFEAILKTDIDKLTRLVHWFSKNSIDINHELKLLRIETVDVEGFPTRIKFDRKFSRESLLKYSYAPAQWKQFADSLKDIYSKIRDTKNPKITIENGKVDDVKKVPVSEVKPIKKNGKKLEDKNTLEVASGDHRRHKSGEHRREKGSEKHKTEATKPEKTKDEIKYKKIEDKHKLKEEAKSDVENVHELKKEKEIKTKKDSKDKTKPDKDEKGQKSLKHKTEEKSSKSRRDESKDRRHKKDDKKESSKHKKDIENSGEPSDKTTKKISKRTTSSEKKLVKTPALCDESELDSAPITNAEAWNTKDSESVDKSNSLKNGQGSSNDNWSKRIKPPNILIYAESLIAKENVKSAFINMLNKDKYTIYDLPTDPKQMMWNDSTVLVVVCGNVPPNLTFHLLQFLLTGGQLLCLCSDFLYSVLHTFTTAEVREHELVRFSYGKWKQVKMMHHIFCYQASPTKKQFSKDSDHSNQSSNSSSPIAPRTPSAVEIQHGGKDYIIQVQVLGTEETWQTPSLLLASVKGGRGRAVFSQVHLEINPNQFEDDENKFEALKGSDQARMEILKDILVNHLEMDCSTQMEIDYTPGYFLGRHDLKLKLFSDCDAIVDKNLNCTRMSAKFCGKDEQAEPASVNFMPIYIHSCPSNFSTVQYFEALATEHIGRLVIYSDVMACSQFLLDKTLSHGIVIIPRQQTTGVGRSNNLWISPIGSAMFSLQVHVPLESPLGQALPLIQHLTMVAVVSAIKSSRGCQDLDIGIKWPNDLYANKTIKIGGLLITSTITDKTAIINIGCGVNLDNVNPTTCINELISISNETKGTHMKPISYEVYFASVFNEFEKVYNIVQQGDMDHFYDLYYKYWLHKNTDVTVAINEGESENMKIVGIDDFGFLKVRSAEGQISTIHPDGNTFDMLKGLISRKTF